MLQERILAPRNVQFTKYQIFWEIMGVDASECFDEGLPGDNRTLKSWETSASMERRGTKPTPPVTTPLG